MFPAESRVRAIGFEPEGREKVWMVGAAAAWTGRETAKAEKTMRATTASAEPAFFIHLLKPGLGAAGFGCYPAIFPSWIRTKRTNIKPHVGRPNV